MGVCENDARISAYHDGELPPAEAEELRRHLGECEACRRELERLRAVSSWLASAPAPVAGAEVMKRLHRSLHPRRDRAVLRVAKALTAAAAVVLVVCSALLWQKWSGAPPPASQVASPPAQWEKVALAPPTSQPILAGAEDTKSAAADVDVQIAESILTDDGALSGNGDNNE